MAGVKEVRRETLLCVKEWHNPNLEVLETAPVLLNTDCSHDCSHGLLLFVALLERVLGGLG